MNRLAISPFILYNIITHRLISLCNRKVPQGGSVTL